ncbi:MAG: glycosyl hydrolase-related protein [Phycisphaerae bacterium]|nr:glycosyl hydrolase-related protein [Phycisphaerae bacterium]
MLTNDWKTRIEQWRAELKTQCFTALGQVAVQGFMTMDHLPYEQAVKGKFNPMPVGTPWGRKWEYGWFKFDITTPKAAAGGRFTLECDPGYEGIIFVNGVVAGATDWGRRHLTLSHNAKPGETFRILIEGYAGHGDTPCWKGPIPPGRVALPEPPAAQRTIGAISFGCWNEEIYQLSMDVDILLSLRDLLHADSLRLQEVDLALREFTTLVDFSLTGDALAKSIAAGRRRLAQVLKCRNGDTAPEIFAVGHGHLDVAWLWPLEETQRKAARTLSNQMALADEYPSHRFINSQAHLFWMVKKHYPEFYKRVVQAVKKGHVIADGGMWVEADTNVAGGEALIRQFLHGKRFFRQEFGVDSRLMWLPDVFGYSGAMPQIMRGCGVDYFSTAKLTWTYNGGEPFPHNTFTWEGIDGSEILVHLIANGYNAQMTPSDIGGRWNARVQKDGLQTQLHAFGWGDGGGGPTRDHVEGGLRMADLEGCPRVRFASPAAFFRDLERRGVPANRYVGELYFQCHRGTYTTQAKTKKGNRFCELALREAEMWASAALAVGAKKYEFPEAVMEELWRDLLLHQFHDILPGSSIQRVYEETEQAHARILGGAVAVRDIATSAVVAGGRTKADDGLTVFNSLGWERSALVSIGQSRAATSADGESLPTQAVDGQTFAEVTLPSCGWTSVTTATKASATATTKATNVKATTRSLENELLRVTFNDRGEIVGLFDKETATELAAGPCNAMHLYGDVPAMFEAWDIDATYTHCPVELTEKATIEVLSQGELAGVLRIRRPINDSVMEQDVWLRRGSRRIDFVTRIDWAERQKLLKVNFPVTVHANEAIHEIQFGHLRRPNHLSRQFDQDRYEVSAHKWTALAEENRGCAVLNDCKYGVNVLGNSINLTLLRSTLFPDPQADQGRQEFTYAFYAWNGPLTTSGLVRQGYELNVHPTTQRGNGGTASLFRVDDPSIVIDTVKPAEDGSGDLVVRLYESLRSRTKTVLHVPPVISSAQQTDMLETPQRKLAIRDGKISLEFRPFEIKTVRLTR